MLRPALLPLALAFILAFAAQPSFAARLEADGFSAEVPKGWTMTQDEEVTNFSSPDSSIELVVILKKYEKPNINEAIAELAGQTQTKKLTDNSYIYEDSSEARAWGMIAEDGTFAEISATAAYDGLAAFIAGLKAADNEKGLAGIFKAAASSKDVLRWLQFIQPRFAASPDDNAAGGNDSAEDEGTPFESTTFTAVVPQGWSAAEQGESVLFTSGAKDASVSVRVYTLASDDGKAFAAWAQEQAKALGGKNLTVGEGVVEFTTDKDANGMFTQFDTKSLFLLFSGESPAIGNLVKSIGLKD